MQRRLLGFDRQDDRFQERRQRRGDHDNTFLGRMKSVRLQERGIAFDLSEQGGIVGYAIPGGKFRIDGRVGGFPAAGLQGAARREADEDGGDAGDFGAVQDGGEIGAGDIWRHAHQEVIGPERDDEQIRLGGDNAPVEPGEAVGRRVTGHAGIDGDGLDPAGTPDGFDLFGQGVFRLQAKSRCQAVAEKHDDYRVAGNCRFSRRRFLDRLRGCGRRGQFCGLTARGQKYHRNGGKCCKKGGWPLPGLRGRRVHTYR